MTADIGTTTIDQPLGTYRAVSGHYGVIEYRLLNDRVESVGIGRFGRVRWRSTTPLCHLDSSFQEEERLYVDRRWAAAGGIQGACAGALFVYLAELEMPLAVVIPLVGVGIGAAASKQRPTGWATFPGRAGLARVSGISVMRCEQQPIDRGRFLEFLNQMSAQIKKCSKAED